jgi:hypothetical protein
MFGRLAVFMCLSTIFTASLYAEVTPLSKGLPEDCLHKIHIGDKIYLYDGVPEITDGTDANSYYTERFFHLVTVKTIKGPLEQNGYFELNGQPVDVSRIYIKFGDIFENLAFAEIGSINDIDPYYGEGILTELLYFDQKGVYHKPQWVGLGMLGKDEILFSCVEIGNKIYGSYKFTKSSGSSKVFSGEISSDTRIAMESFEEAGSTSLFNGEISAGRIKGIWKNKLGNSEMNIAISEVNEGILGHYVGTEPDILIQYLEVFISDNGTYLLHFQSGLYHEVDLSLVGYVDKLGNFKWHCNGQKEYGSCGQTICFHGGLVEANCQGPSGNEVVRATGSFRKP